MLAQILFHKVLDCIGTKAGKLLNNYHFDNRSCVDLKDKWRNIEFSRNRQNTRSRSATIPTATPTEQQPMLGDKIPLPSVSNGNYIANMNVGMGMIPLDNYDATNALSK